MSYFSADERLEARAMPAPAETTQLRKGEPGALFAADERLEAGAQAPAPPVPSGQDKSLQAEVTSLFAADERLEAGVTVAVTPEQTEAAACPACGASLVPDDGWLACPACAARYLEVHGTLAAANALSHGACACCRPRQALVLEHGRPLCPLSGRPHALHADGHAQLADEPGVAVAETATLPGLAEIDAALAANSALLATHGVFVTS